LKKRPTRALIVLLAALLGIPAAIVGVASVPDPPARAAVAPRVEAVARGEGPLSAGAAEVRFQLPPHASIGGFARLSYEAIGVRDPVGARAVVVSAGGCRVALVSAELVLVPEALEEAVRARVSDLPLQGLVLAATHTHAGPGGYWEHGLGEKLGTGPYDPAARDAIANAIAEAIRRAAAAEGPAQLALARGRSETLVRNRAGGDLKDARLVVLRLTRPDGVPVAEVALFPAHPTLLGKANRSLSGDWAGHFQAVTSHGVRLLFQGAGGDQSARLPTPGPVSPETYAAAVSTAVDRLAFGPPDGTVKLGWAAADVTLPAVDPGFVPGFAERAARNLTADVLPGHATVAALRLGPVLLALVPGEPTAEVGARLRELAGPGAEVLSLAGGYVGYVETAAKVAAGKGEARRTYYGPELAERIEKAVAATAQAARGGNGAAAGGGGGASRAALPARGR
jgi:neutral ceramidase